jgi:hypothetical protein
MDTKAPKLAAVVMLVLFLSLGVTPAYSQTDDESVQAALTRGYSVSGSYVSDCEASRRGGGLLGRLGSVLIDSLATSFDVLRWGGEYNVVVQSHYGLIAEVASRTARQFKPTPSLQDVPSGMRAPSLYVRVVPKGDRDDILGYNMQASIDHIVVGPKDNVSVETAVQPIGPLTTDSTGFQNLFGASLSVPENTAMANFPVEGVMSAIENDDLRIYIISPGGSGSWDCDIDADDIQRMFTVG